MLLVSSHRNTSFPVGDEESPVNTQHTHTGWEVDLVHGTHPHHQDLNKPEPKRTKRAPPGAVPRSFLAHGHRTKIDAPAEYAILKLIAQQEKIL